MGTPGGDKRIDSDCVAVIITAPSADAAEKLALGLLDEKLAACVNILPGVRSFFWWNGKVEQANECMMICKTTSGLSEKLVKYVRRNHEYEVPEVIVLPIIGGNRDYLKWIKESTVE